MRAFIIALFCLSACFAAEGDSLPASAQAAVDRYENVTDKLNQEAMLKIAKERDRLVSELNKLMVAEGKKGNVDGVIAIKAKMDKMQAESAEEARKAGTDLLGNKIAFQIVSAKYGAGTIWKDCTEVVQKAVKRDKVEMSATDVFNAVGDPAPFVVKQVVIEYIINGEHKTGTFPENSQIRLPER